MKKISFDVLSIVFSFIKTKVKFHLKDTFGVVCFLSKIFIHNEIYDYCAVLLTIEL
jgi:hypothetical protein